MDLILYTVFLVISTVLAFIEQTSKKRLYFFEISVIACFFLIVCTREVNGSADTFAYVDDFYSVTLNKLYNSSNLDTKYKFEIGYSIFCQICKFLTGDNIVLFFFLIAFIQYFLIKISVRNFLLAYKISEVPNNLNYLPFFLLYISLFGFMYNGIVLRAGLSISFFIFGTSYLLRRKVIYGALFVFIALSMHRSSFFGFFAWIPLFFKATINKNKALALLSIVLVFYIFKVHVLISSFVSQYFIGLLGDIQDVRSQKFSNYLGNVNSNLSSYSIVIFFNFFLSYFIQMNTDNKPLFVKKFATINAYSTCSLALMSAIPAVSRIFDFYIIYTLILVYYLIFVDFSLKSRIAFLLTVLVYSINFYRLAILPFQ
ncbi:EpsG family protein [Sphingobacterium siyangense]|uniref:EpsG-like putative glucosyltransferase n=1 Tax=Sphingobacterium siyangense TaxID=459529 RepID=A0A562MK79_9SPHI|nr:EpsG-like putative glucosyltransferase [Sphingobacterium siyangense]